jgi:hypothetical protein
MAEETEKKPRMGKSYSEAMCMQWLLEIDVEVRGKWAERGPACS